MIGRFFLELNADDLSSDLLARFQIKPLNLYSQWPRKR